MSRESPPTSDNEWDEWEIINLQTKSIVNVIKSKKPKKKDIENLAKEIQDQLSINQQEERMKLEELTSKLNEQTQMSEAKLQEIAAQLQSIVKLQEITQQNHQETTAKLCETNNKLQQIEKETKLHNNQIPSILSLPTTASLPSVSLPPFPTSSLHSLLSPIQPQLPSQQQFTNYNNNNINNDLFSFQKNNNNNYNNNNNNNNNANLNNLNREFAFGSNTSTSWTSLTPTNNINVNPTVNTNVPIANTKNTNTNNHNNNKNNNDSSSTMNSKLNFINNENKNEKTNVDVKTNVNSNTNANQNVNVDGNDKNNKNKDGITNENIYDFKLKCKNNIGENVFEPNEQRQCGWLLTNNTKSKLKLKGYLKKIGGDDSIVVKTQKVYEFEISSNEEIRLMCDVVAPNIVGKYCLFYQFTSENDSCITDILELIIEVKSKFSKEQEDVITNIIKMGFDDRNKIVYALQKSKWNIQQAVDNLLSN